MRTETEIKNRTTGETFTMVKDFETAQLNNDGSVWVDFDEFWDEVNDHVPFGHDIEVGKTKSSKTKVNNNK